MNIPQIAFSEFVTDLYSFVYAGLWFISFLIASVVGVFVGLYVIVLGLIAVYAYFRGGGIMRPHQVIYEFGMGVFTVHKLLFQSVWAGLLAILEFIRTIKPFG